MRSRYLHFVLVCVGMVVLQGCSSKNMTSTLFDINSEYDNDGGIGAIKQTRVMTINPLISFEEVGQVCFFDPRRGSETAVYLDVKNINPKKIVKEYTSHVKEQELMEIRDGFVKLNRDTKKLLQIQQELAQLQLYKKSKEFETLKNSAVDITDITTKIGTLQKNLSDMVKELPKNYENVLNKLKKSNAIIFKLNGEKEKDAGLNLGKVAGINGNRKKSSSKLVLASGLKSERLILDKKTLKTIDSALNDKFKFKTGIITYTLSAKYFTYVTQEDLSTMLGLDLDVNLKEYKEILQKIDQLRLQIAASSVENALSGGFFSEPMVKKVDVVLDGCDTQAECDKINNNITRSVFFAVYTKLSKLNKLFIEKMEEK